jgi:hypothetical protein
MIFTILLKLPKILKKIFAKSKTFLGNKNWERKIMNERMSIGFCIRKSSQKKAHFRTHRVKTTAEKGVFENSPKSESIDAGNHIWS